jgi:hypothetical protein
MVRWGRSFHLLRECSATLAPALRARRTICLANRGETHTEQGGNPHLSLEY